MIRKMALAHPSSLWPSKVSSSFQLEMEHQLWKMVIFDSLHIIFPVLLVSSLFNYTYTRYNASVITCGVKVLSKSSRNQYLSVNFSGSRVWEICDGYQVQYRHENWRQLKNVQITEGKLWQGSEHCRKYSVHHINISDKIQYKTSAEGYKFHWQTIVVTSCELLFIFIIWGWLWQVFFLIVVYLMAL